MDSPTANPPIAWDDSAAHSLVFPNFCNVTKSDRDVTLLFGTGRPAPAPDQPMTVEIRDRITMAPIAAKLLGNLLHHTIIAYEAQHGPIGDGFQPIPGSGTLPGSVPPLLTREELPQRAQLLLELIEALNVPITVERSLKFLPGALLHERFLLSLDAEHLSSSARTRLPVLCRRLRMPVPMIEALEKSLPTAHSLHFGFEAQEDTCVYKAYVEPGGAAREAVKEGRPDPVTLYTGFKWDPETSEKSATSDYVAYPALKLDTVRSRTDAFFTDGAGYVPREITSELLDLAGARCSASQMLFVEVTELENPRSSFDLNLYPAGLELAELHPLLFQAARHYGIPFETFRTHYERFRRHSFGHVSGGTDRAGRSFLTFYFGGRIPSSQA